MPKVLRRHVGAEARQLAAAGGYCHPNMRGIHERVELLLLVAAAPTDPGPDWIEWRAYGEDGGLITTQRWELFP